MLCFFVMSYSSIRLLSYIINAFCNRFEFGKVHKYVGVSVYLVFIVVFVVFEFFFFK
jgi:hypothetical protein